MLAVRGTLRSDCGRKLLYVVEKPVLRGGDETGGGGVVFGDDFFGRVVTERMPEIADVRERGSVVGGKRRPLLIGGDVAAERVGRDFAVFAARACEQERRGKLKDDGKSRGSREVDDGDVAVCGNHLPDVVVAVGGAVRQACSVDGEQGDAL